MRTSSRTSGVLGGALLAVLLLAGCTGSGSDELSSDSAGARSAVDVAPEAPAEMAGIRLDGAVEGGLREVITTGSLTLVADEPRAAVQAIAELVESSGGRVESRSEHTAQDGSDPSGQITVRVPAAKVTATVDALDGVGDVQDLSLDAEDVTATAIDLDARVQALATSVARLEALMGQAATTADLLSAEKELTARQAELESLQSQRASLTDRVDMSTLHVQVVAEAPPAAIRPAGFLGGLDRGWSALLTTIDGLVIVVGVLLPWLAVAALAALVVRLVVRRTRRRRAGGSPTDTGHAPASGPDPGPGRSPHETEPLVDAGERRG